MIKPSDFFRIDKYHNEYIVRILDINLEVWTEKSFKLLYVTNHYPSPNINNAIKFNSLKIAKQYIKKIDKNCE